MARIRTIKPIMARHEKLFDFEEETGWPIRFIWAMLPTICDREGRFEWRSRSLKSEIAPYDDLDFSRVLDAFATRGFIVKYAVKTGEIERTYGVIPTFTKHQVINNRESKSELPDPRDMFSEIIVDIEGIYASGTRQPRVNNASATREPRDVDVEKRKGREGKGKEGEVYTVDFENFWNVYPSRQPHSNPKKPASPKFEAALKRGVEAHTIIDGAMRYAEYIRREGTNPKHVAQATTWLNQERWNDNNSAAPRREPTQGDIAG